MRARPFLPGERKPRVLPGGLADEQHRENVILLGPPGVWATHLAVAAAQSGHRVYYGTLADLLTSLEVAQAPGRLQSRLKVLKHPDVLATDEIGYLPNSRTGAMVFSS